MRRKIQQIYMSKSIDLGNRIYRRDILEQAKRITMT